MKIRYTGNRGVPSTYRCRDGRVLRLTKADAELDVPKDVDALSAQDLRRDGFELVAEPKTKRRAARAPNEE